MHSLEMLRPGEVATTLKITRAKVYDMLAAGELPAVRIGKCVRVPAADLERWLAARLAPAAADDDWRRS